MSIIYRLLDKPLADQVAAIRLGFEAAEAEKLAVDYHLHRQELATLLGLTPRALLHRVRKNLRLDSVESERLFRLIRVANHVFGIFGDSISVGDWLMRPHSLLDLATPLSMLDTAYGEREIERILCSIEYGLPV